MTMNDLPEELGREEDRREDQKLRNAIAFGFDVQNWVRGPIGRYCTEKSDAEIAGFHLELERERDLQKIAELQLEIAARRLWQNWLGEAIQEGLNAQKEFIEQGM
jgi:hypothetical protein